MLACNLLIYEYYSKPAGLAASLSLRVMELFVSHRFLITHWRDPERKRWLVLGEIRRRKGRVTEAARSTRRCDAGALKANHALTRIGR